MIRLPWRSPSCRPGLRAVRELPTQFAESWVVGVRRTERYYRRRVAVGPAVGRQLRGEAPLGAALLARATRRGILRQADCIHAPVQPETTGDRQEECESARPH